MDKCGSKWIKIGLNWIKLDQTESKLIKLDLIKLDQIGLNLIKIVQTCLAKPTLQMFAGNYRDFAGKSECRDFKITGIAGIPVIPIISHFR